MSFPYERMVVNPPSHGRARFQFLRDCLFLLTATFLALKLPLLFLIRPEDPQYQILGFNPLWQLQSGPNFENAVFAFLCLMCIAPKEHVLLVDNISALSYVVLSFAMGALISAVTSDGEQLNSFSIQVVQLLVVIQAMFLMIFAFYTAKVFMDQVYSENAQLEQYYCEVIEESDAVMKQVLDEIKEAEAEYRSFVERFQVNREDLYLRHRVVEIEDDLSPVIEEDTNREDLYLRHEIQEAEEGCRATIIEAEIDNEEDPHMPDEVNQAEAEFLAIWSSKIR